MICHRALVGAVLALAERPVTDALRAMGLTHTPQFHHYPRVLSRARGSGVAVSRSLLRQLTATFVPDGALSLSVYDSLCYVA